MVTTACGLDLLPALFRVILASFFCVTLAFIRVKFAFYWDKIACWDSALRNPSTVTDRIALSPS
jgi:hypothetical protein